MNKENITKEQFDKFIRLRRAGIINMTDIVHGAMIIEESEDVYETILWNFKYLRKKYYGNN